MENTQLNPLDIPSIRQSTEWANYFTGLGWDHKTTSSGVLILYKKLPLIGSLVKIQKPKILDQKDFYEIDLVCKKIRAVFVKLEPIAGQDTDIILANRYKNSFQPLSSTLTSIICLSKDRDTLWGGLSKSAKYSVKRALREGVSTKLFVEPSDEVLETFFKVFKYTGESKNFYVPPFKDLKIKRDVFKNKCYVVLVYNKNKELTGGKLFVGYKNLIWYLHGGTTVAGRRDTSGYLLMWNSIMFFKNKGYDFMDLEGMYDTRFPRFTDGWYGFSFFKEKFGGEIIQFPGPFIKIYSPIFKILSKIPFFKL